MRGYMLYWEQIHTGLGGGNKPEKYKEIKLLKDRKEDHEYEGVIYKLLEERPTREIIQACDWWMLTLVIIIWQWSHDVLCISVNNTTACRSSGYCIRHNSRNQDQMQEMTEMLLNKCLERCPTVDHMVQYRQSLYNIHNLARSIK